MNSGYRRRLHSHWHSKEAVWPHNSGFSRQSCTSSAIRPAAFFLPPARSQEVSPSNRVKACRSSTCCWMKGNKEFWFKRIRIFLPWVFCSGESNVQAAFSVSKSSLHPINRLRLRPPHRLPYRMPQWYWGRPTHISTPPTVVPGRCRTPPASQPTSVPLQTECLWRGR